MATPTIVAGTASQGAQGTGNPAVALTSNIAAGDVLVLFVGQQYSPSVTTEPSSFSGGAGTTWYPLIEVNNGSIATIAYARFATAADIGATITATISGGVQKSLGYVAVRGCSGLPVAKAASQNSATALTLSLASAQVATQEANALILQAWQGILTSGTGTYSWSTQPTGTILAGVGGTSNGVNHLLATANLAARGTSTALTAAATETTGSGTFALSSVTLSFYGTAPTSQVGARGGYAIGTGPTSITVPSFFQAGDLAILSMSGSNAQTAAPSGWTLLGSLGSTANTYVYAKSLVAGDIGATVTPSVTSGLVGIAIEAFYNWGLTNSTSLTSLFVGTTTVASGSTVSTPATTVPIVGSYTYQVWTGQYSLSGPADWLAAIPNTNVIPMIGSWMQGGQTFPSGNWPSNGRIATSHQYQASTGSAATVTWTTPGSFNATSGVVQLLIPAISPPLAPTLQTPATGTYEDMSGTPTFTWTYNPTPGDGTQNAIDFRRKISGAPSYSHWNSGSSTWQSTALYIGDTAQSITFPSGAWANGNVYNWNVSTQESLNSQQSPFATSDFTVTAQGPPTVSISAPTGTIHTTTPTVTFTITPYAGTGAGITGYRVIIYTAAQVAAGGFSPGTTTGVYDTGTVATVGSPDSVTVPAGLLSNSVTYYAYVQATETGGEASAWASQSFAVSFDAPAAPTISVVGLPANTAGTVGPAAQITVTGHDNLASALDASVEGSLGTWTAGANTTAAVSTAQAEDGSDSMSLTATAGGSVSAQTATGTSGYPVTAGQVYSALAGFRAAATARAATVAVTWYTAAGAVISTSTSAAVTDGTGGWTQAAISATAPANAAFAALTVTVAGAVAAEVHYVDQMGLFPGTTTTWTRGGLLGTQYANVYRSTDGGATWTALRAGPVQMSNPGQRAVLVDYEVPLNASVLYEATVTSPANGIASAYSATASVIVAPGNFIWVHDPLQTDVQVQLNLLPSTSGGVGGVSGVGWYALQHEETSNVDYALGRDDAIVQHGDQHFPTFDVAWVANVQSDYNSFMALRARRRTLCFRFRDGTVIYGTTGSALVDLVLRPPDPSGDPTTQAAVAAAGTVYSAWQPRALQTVITAVATP